MSDYIDVYLFEKKLKVIIFNHTDFLNAPEKQRTPKIGEHFEECLRKILGHNIEIEHVKSREKEISDENGAMKMVNCHDDLMATNVLKLIKTVSENGDSYSGLIVFVSSHGGMTIIHEEFCELIEAYDKKYRKSQLWECFRNKAGWKGKPLMFFFQACRGSDSTQGVRSSIDASKISDLKEGMPQRIFPDLFIMNATQPGAVAFKSDKSSIFVEKLCSTLSESAHQLDLKSIAVKVSNEVAQTFESCDMLEHEYFCSQQMPSFESTFTKKCYLFTQYQPHPKIDRYYESLEKPFILFLNYEEKDNQNGEKHRIDKDTRLLRNYFEKIGYGTHEEPNATFKRYKELTEKFYNRNDKSAFG